MSTRLAAMERTPENLQKPAPSPSDTPDSVRHSEFAHPSESHRGEEVHLEHLRSALERPSSELYRRVEHLEKTVEGMKQDKPNDSLNDTLQIFSTQLQQVNAKLEQLLLAGATPTNIYYRPKISYQDSMNNVRVRRSHVNSNNNHSTNDYSNRTRHGDSSSAYHTHCYSPAKESLREEYTEDQVTPEDLVQANPPPAPNTFSPAPEGPEPHLDSLSPRPEEGSTASSNSIPPDPPPDDTPTSTFLRRVLRLIFAL